MSCKEERLMRGAVGRLLFFFTTILSVLVARRAERERGLGEKKKHHGIV